MKEQETSLENILKPLRWADKKLLKQYTKLAMKMPGKRLYKVSSLAQFAGISCFVGWLGSTDIQPDLVIAYCLGLIQMPDMYHNIRGLTGRIETESDGSSLELDENNEFYKRVGRKFRLPMFLSGAALLVKAGIEIVNYFTTGQPPDSASATIVGGLGLMSCASSIYLKDHDPALLEKEGSWAKRAYERLQEYFTPAPEPVPVPVKNPPERRLQEEVK